MEDVALFTIRVIEEGEARIAMGVVLDGGHPTHNTVLIAAEINDSIEAFVATAAVTRRDAAINVATTGLVLALGERTLRTLLRESLHLVE